jgi:hypothetical protein
LPSQTHYWGKDRRRAWLKWREDIELDVTSYWITLRKWPGAVNWNRKHQIALCGETSFEEAVELS